MPSETIQAMAIRYRASRLVRRTPYHNGKLMAMNLSKEMMRRFHILEMMRGKF